jgi:uncharacterized protein (DUF302 family)
MSALGFSVQLALPFDAALGRVRDALKAEGFGVLTEIDMRQAFRDKLGREIRPFVILGACNPPLAWSAIHANPEVGLLLPCNVTVERLEDDRTLVRLTDPQALLSQIALAATADVPAIAKDAHERMTRVAAALAAT